jgi:L-ascorbate metabolism protein UlaG (beta-lactamase superfamily)
MKIEWLGHDAFRITTDQKVIYIDPYQLKKHEPKADLILVSHAHFDHLSKEDLDKLVKDSTVIVGPKAVVSELGRGVALAPGESKEFDGIRVTAVHAYNVNKFSSPGNPFHPKGEGVGYVLEIEGQKLYHTGDSDHIPEMEGLEPDIVFVPVSGTYVMTAEEAVQAVKAMRAKKAIPMHYGAIVGSEDDARKFASLADIEVEIMQKVE